MLKIKQTMSTEKKSIWNYLFCKKHSALSNLITSSFTVYEIKNVSLCSLLNFFNCQDKARPLTYGIARLLSQEEGANLTEGAYNPA